jgi:xanthine dehydrogenase YagR molybdenum-binding subunit
MKFDTPAGTNPIDQLKVVGKPTDRIDGPLKTTGTAPYAYERHDVAPNQAYGYVWAAPSPRAASTIHEPGRAKAAPGVIAIVTAENAGKLGRARATPPICWRAPRSSTTTRPSRWWSPRPSNRPAPHRALIRVDYEKTRAL